MKFFRGLFGGSRKVDAASQSDTVEPEYKDLLARPANNDGKGSAEADAEATRKASERSAVEAEKVNVESRSGTEDATSATSEKSTINMIRDINAKLESKPEVPPAEVKPETAENTGAASPSIWDLDVDVPQADDLAKETTVDPSPPRASARQRRTKTRLIGFDKSDGSSVDALSPAPAATASIEPAPKVTFPVGWILIVKGPGRGESFPLVNGLSTIGRGVDQTVRLDFGDAAISRSGHAALAYDASKKTFMLGHGNKANIVRLNDKPVITNESITNGDHIRIGETTLRLVTLIGEDFDWSNYDDPEGDEDVAIA